MIKDSIVLASILYNLCNINEGAQRKEVIDEFAKKWDVQINIFDQNITLIYKTNDKITQIKILYYNNKCLHLSRKTLINEAKIKKVKSVPVVVEKNWKKNFCLEKWICQ